MKTISQEQMKTLLIALNKNEITQERFEIIIKLLTESII